MAGKFPAHSRDAAASADRQQPRRGFDRQDQSGRRRFITKRARFVEVETAKDLGRDHLHLTIGLNQETSIRRQRCEGLLPQEFRIGSLAGGPFGHQFIAPFHQPCAPRRRKAFLQSLQLIHERIEKLIPVLQKQFQALPFLTQILQFLAKALLLQSGETSQRHRQHSISLTFRQIQTHHQAGSGGRRIGCLLDHADHVLQVVQRGDQA